MLLHFKGLISSLGKSHNCSFCEYFNIKELRAIIESADKLKLTMSFTITYVLALKNGATCIISTLISNLSKTGSKLFVKIL